MSEDTSSNNIDRELSELIDSVVESSISSEEEKIELFRRTMQMIEDGKQEVV